jgi:hypothetical protein
VGAAQRPHDETAAGSSHFGLPVDPAAVFSLRNQKVNKQK